ncbi:MAG TPA: hypothetical protein VKT32_09795 [Chthonomonadaceae bacterium]|nr:hypothetical protein [Chthonomonadaceae bacterium]
MSVNSLPFLLTPGAGAEGRIHHLQLRLRDFTLSGLPVARFDADVPGIRFDIGRTLRRKEVVLSRAGSGLAEAHITPEGLRAFISGKYEQTLSDVLIWTQNRKLFIQGQVRLFGAPTPFTASCALAPRDGRYVDLTQVMVWMGSARLSARNADAITAQFNPVLDIVSDLGLGGYLTLSGVEIGDGFVTLRGQATLPTAALPTGKL